MVTHLPPIPDQGQPHAEPLARSLPRPGLPRGLQLCGQVSSAAGPEGHGAVTLRPHSASVWALFYPPPSTLHSINSLDENTVNAPGDNHLKAKVSVQRAAGAQQGVVPPHPASLPLCCGPRAAGPLMSLPLYPLDSPQLLGRTGVSLSPISVPIPPDHTLLLQQGKAQLTDPTDEEVLVAALNLKEPTKTAYVNTTFTTTDL